MNNHATLTRKILGKRELTLLPVKAYVKLKDKIVWQSYMNQEKPPLVHFHMEMDGRGGVEGSQNKVIWRKTNQILLVLELTTTFQ